VAGKFGPEIAVHLVASSARFFHYISRFLSGKTKVNH